jgi:nucleoside-diphosphate-sugar epimerase
MLSSTPDSVRMSQVLVTGASGFIGGAVVTQLVSDGWNVEGTVRRPTSLIWEVHSPSLGNDVDWRPLLAGKTVIIHTAARAHVMHERAADPMAEFQCINVVSTLRLAEQAAAVGVRRFVFVSSIGVNGEQSAPGKAFSEADQPNPHNAYALSKWEAEQGLMRIAEETGLEVVIIRPPLVYGANAPGNFGKLTRVVAKGLPLPLASIDNRRSYVGIDNLIDFIVTCLEHPFAANETFFVSDGEDLSTPDLIRRMARAMNRPARLLPVPTFVLMATAAMLGRRDMAQRLCGSLQVDISKSRQLLGWNPPFSVDEGLKRAVGGK